MKVALLIDTWFPQIGGGQTNAWEISKRLAGNGINIDIITRNTGPDSLKLPKNLNIIKLGPRAKSSDYISKITFLFRAYLSVARGNYDLVHAHAFLPGIPARLISITKRIPTVFSVHGTSVGTGLNSFFKEWLEKFILTGIRYNAQISVSQDFLKLKNVNKQSFSANKNIHYVPNGVEVKDFDKVTVAKAKDPTLIFVGRLHPQKNLPNLIKAISIVKNEIPNIKLLIVGNGPERGNLVNLVKDLHLSTGVVFKGEVIGQNLVKLYKSSRVFILPSIYEGQPLTLLEAWASKLPVLVSVTGDLPYLVKDGYSGYLIQNPKDIEEIASQIKKALGSKNLQKMGQNGYNLVKTRFAWEKSAQDTLYIYKNLLNGSSPIKL